MTASSAPELLALTPVRARSAGFLADTLSIAGRAVRAIPREPEAIIPALVIPIFFYVVNLGALSDVTESIPGFDFKAFYLPVGLVFAVTGVSRASALVTDIQSGYFDRLLLTPISRLALLLGLMVADVLLMMALTIPVLIIGFAVGVSYETGPAGVVALIVMTGAWGLAFTGFPYAIALKTGNPAAVNTSFLLFFPFAFLTTAFTPRDLLSGWLETLASVNPVTYLLDGMRALILDGWAARDIGIGLLAIIGVGVVSQVLAFAALRGRIART
ncbi:MAG: ABC transporter permease [Acidimicrobiia bacterium]